MIKFLTALCILLGLACLPPAVQALVGTPMLAGNTTPAVGTLTCDVGQSFTGSIPAPLSRRSDLQHCAWFADFSNAAYANPSSNWVGCFNFGNSTFPTGGFSWYQQGNNGANPTMACSTIQQVFDAGIGKNVLDIQHPSSGYNASGDSQQLVTATHACSNTVGCTSGTFPSNYYAEIKFKSVQTTLGTNAGGFPILSWWEFSVPDGSGTTLERDFYELYGGAVNNCTGDSQSNNIGAVWGFGNDGNPLTPCGPYYTLGIRVTSDGTNESYCAYVNGTLAGIGCRTGTNNGGVGGHNGLTLRDFMILSNSNSPITEDYYVQYMVVFSCNSWQSTQCNGTVLTGTP